MQGSSRRGRGCGWTESARASRGRPVMRSSGIAGAGARRCDSCAARTRPARWRRLFFIPAGPPQSSRAPRLWGRPSILSNCPIRESPTELAHPAATDTGAGPRAGMSLTRAVSHAPYELILSEPPLCVIRRNGGSGRSMRRTTPRYPTQHTYSPGRHARLEAEFQNFDVESPRRWPNCPDKQRRCGRATAGRAGYRRRRCGRWRRTRPGVSSRIGACRPATSPTAASRPRSRR